MSDGNTSPTQGISWKSGQSGPRRGRGRGRKARFGAMNILYDEEGYEYPIDEYGQIYVPLEPKRTVARENEEEIKKVQELKDPMPVWPLLVPQVAQRE